MILKFEFIKEYTFQGTRKTILEDLNGNFAKLYVSGEVNTLLKARTTRGERAYRHKLSKLWRGGFRVFVSVGQMLGADTIQQLGIYFLENKILMRKLITMGYDTLEVYGGSREKYYQWNISKYTD